MEFINQKDVSRFLKPNINRIANLWTPVLKIWKERNCDKGSNSMTCLQVSEHLMSTKASCHYWISNKTLHLLRHNLKKHKDNKYSLSIDEMFQMTLRDKRKLHPPPTFQQEVTCAFS